MLVSSDAIFPKKLKPIFEPKRYKVLYGGRGSAKSWSVARKFLIDGLYQPLRFLCARELQNSIKDSVHKLLSDQIAELGLYDHYEVQAAVIKGKNGTEFAFEGLRHNVTKIKSYEGVDRVWVEEAQMVTKTSWDVLIPTIRKANSEIWITFNPEFEDDDTYERFVLHPPENAAVININWRDNKWFPQVLEEERLALKKRDPDSYDHVWEGKCRRWLDGAIYADELREAYDENRILEVPHDPEAKVYTAWDIGRTDDTAIWWYQLVGNEIHIIESFAKTGGDPSYFASQVLGKRVQIDIIDGELKVTIGDEIEVLEHRTQYEYEKHWLPHDARAKTFAASGKSTQQQLAAAFGWGMVGITPSLDREDGIKVARSTFPKCYFDKEKASEGLKALRKYKRELQPDERSLKAAPKHDWTSHYADAFRYLSIAWQKDPKPHHEPTQETDAWGKRFSGESNWKTN